VPTGIKIPIVFAAQCGEPGQTRCPRDKNTIRFRTPTG
jgi:hypothetical protein